ncbi:hypothetical protein BDW22DRAFT_1355741, partial [Trametopsis cervina]
CIAALSFGDAEDHFHESIMDTTHMRGSYGLGHVRTQRILLVFLHPNSVSQSKPRLWSTHSIR